VRVPVFTGHSLSINARFERPIGPDEARAVATWMSDDFYSPAAQLRRRPADTRDRLTRAGRMKLLNSFPNVDGAW
jgi:aspartate-semialdehyde dehydrogenase